MPYLTPSAQTDLGVPLLACLHGLVRSIYPFNRTMYLSIIVATNNVNQALQHTRLSFMLKNVAEYTRMHKIGVSRVFVFP